MNSAELSSEYDVPNLLPEELQSLTIRVVP